MSTSFEMPRLRTLARHALPKLIETTVIPVGLFVGVLHFFGLWGAMAAGLGWSYAAVLRRVVARQRIPGLLLIGTLTLTARSALAFATGWSRSRSSCRWCSVARWPSASPPTSVRFLTT
jgi:hypothetical protein